jgi:purine nucleosidase
VKRVIVDCDPGQDDAIALLLAVGSPEELDLLAVTTVAGNVSERACNGNARRILEAVDRSDVPVHSGCARPLLRAYEPYFADDEGLPGIELPDPVVGPAGGHAVDVILETVGSRPPGTVTLCALGPLTNVALALAKDPDLATRLDGIAFMGGAAGLGNVTPAAEFNILTDPHAAAIVFASGADLTMFGLEVCHRAVVDDGWVAGLADLGTRAADITAGLLRSYGHAVDAERYRSLGLPLYDPCVIAWLVAPEIFTGARHRVDVELEGTFSQGRTLVDVENLTGNPPNTLVMNDLDLGAFRELLEDRLGRGFARSRPEEKT